MGRNRGRRRLMGVFRFGDEGVDHGGEQDPAKKAVTLIHFPIVGP